MTFKKQKGVTRMKNKIKNTIILTSLAIFFMHLINRFIFTISTIKDILKSDTGHSYEWRFGKIFYTKQGVGSPILLVHDLNTYGSAYEWDEIVHTLSRTHTVYTIDLLGCGRSDKPVMTYTNYLYVQLISDFVKNVIRHRTDVIGSGLSSSFIIMAGYNDDTLFDKIMMINPDSLSALNRIPTKRTKLLKFLIEIPVIGTAVYNIIVNQKNTENAFIENYLFNPFRLKTKYVNASYEAAHIGGANAKYLLSSLKGNYINASISRSIKEINNSIFIVGGEEEPNIQKSVREYEDANNSIESIILDNVKHFPQIESPEALLEHIHVFFYTRVDTL